MRYTIVDAPGWYMISKTSSTMNNHKTSVVPKIKVRVKKPILPLDYGMTVYLIHSLKPPMRPRPNLCNWITI